MQPPASPALQNLPRPRENLNFETSNQFQGTRGQRLGRGLHLFYGL
jgi:hypothetical protein